MNTYGAMHHSTTHLMNPYGALECVMFRGKNVKCILQDSSFLYFLIKL